MSVNIEIARCKKDKYGYFEIIEHSNFKVYDLMTCLIEYFPRCAKELIDYLNDPEIESWQANITVIVMEKDYIYVTDVYDENQKSEKNFKTTRANFIKMIEAWCMVAKNAQEIVLEYNEVDDSFRIYDPKRKMQKIIA